MNLETFKDEILDYLESSEFAIYHSLPGDMPGLPSISWDAERYPDYQLFLAVAKKLGVEVVLFAHRQFDVQALENAIALLDEAELSGEERRDFERRLRALRTHTGKTCSLELSFQKNSCLYTYDVATDWYEKFLELFEEIDASLPDEDEPVDDDSLGGYFSKN